MRPAHEDAPKPMLLVDGKPMVERLLTQLIDCGFRKFTVVTGHKGPLIEGHLTACRQAARADVEVKFHREASPLGNAGVLGAIQCADERVLFAFADLVTHLDFRRLLATHQQRRCDVTLASHYEEHRLTLGELEADGDRVTGYWEKPLKRFLICSGIAVFEPRVLQVARELPAPLGLADLVRGALGRGLHVTHWIHNALWMDVNTPEILEQARTVLGHASAFG